MSLEPVPEWLLERYVAGDLPSDEADEVRGRLRAEEGGLARAAALEQSNIDVRIRYPGRDMVPEIRRKAGVAEPTVRSWKLMVPMLVAAVALLVLVPTIVPSTPTNPDILLKGAQPLLRVYQQIDGAAVRVKPGDRLPAGATLQLAYEAAGASHGVIVSIDGAGVVTVHHPPSGSDATSLEIGGQVLLPTAYQLDEAPGFERFFLVVGSEPVPLSMVKTSAARLAGSPAAGSGSLVLEGPWTQVEFTVRKP